MNPSKWIDAQTGEPRWGKIAATVVLFFIVLILFFGSFGTINAGERGVLTRFNAVVGVKQPGLYFKIPLIDKVTRMDVRTQSLIAQQDTPLTAASKDLQDTKLAVVVNYHINPLTVVDIYQQYGDANTYYQNIVNPLLVATIKSVASTYDASEQVQKRPEMAEKAYAALVAAFEGKNVSIEKVDITDIQFSAEFTHSIEAKVTAVQNAEAAKNKLAQVQYEAQQRIEQAKGEAEAIRIQSAAIQSQGGENYVELKTIEKWNGAGCTSYCGLEASAGLLVTGK